MDALNDRAKPLNGSKVLVLGVAYKPDIDDVRESPSLDVIALLEKKGAQVQYHDPYIPSFRTHDGRQMESISDAELIPAVRAADAVLIITNHKVYDYKAILAAAQFIFDSRNALGKLGKENPKVVRL